MQPEKYCEIGAVDAGRRSHPAAAALEAAARAQGFL